jgi:hypothetical protein
MTINHSDPTIQHVFDRELAAARLGLDHVAVPACIRSQADRDLTIGVLAASERNPTPAEKLVRDLAARCTFVDGKLVMPADLDPATDPILLNQAKTIAWLAHRARTDLASRS